MATTPNPLRDASFMTAFLDTFIPASADGVMPGAGALGIADGVAASIEDDAALGPIVEAGLKAAVEAAGVLGRGDFADLGSVDRITVIDGVIKQHPVLMNAFARHLYPAYYQHPRVLEAIGEPARPPFPEGFEIEPTDPALLAILESRR